MKAVVRFCAGSAVAIVLAAILVMGIELALHFVPAGQGYFLADEGTSSGNNERAIRLPLFPPGSRYIFRPSREYVEARTDGLEVREYVTEIDADGFIKPGRIHARPELTIAFLGGSTTENFLVPAAARFPHLAGQQVAACTGQRVNTINAGRSGITSMHSLNIFLNSVVPLKPDIVVMMHNINDYAVLHHEGSYWNDHPSLSLLTTVATEPSAPANLVTRLANFAFPRTANFVRHHFGTTPDTQHAERPPRWSEAKPIQIERVRAPFARALETFVRTARAWEVQPVLMTMPDRWPDSVETATGSFESLVRDKLFGILDYAEFTRGFDAMNETVRETAERLNVPVIDLAKAIPPSTELMFDAIHFNEAGSRMASEIIAAQMGEIIGEECSP